MSRRDVVLMPSFVNLGAYVDEKTMVDTWVTVGSCAQIGKNVHLSGGVGIGGVLEPLQANPTVIEDDCFIGARSEVVEGVIVGEGSVVSMGVFLSASTKIIERATGKVHMGYVPPYSVVVSGSLPGKALPDGSPGPSLYCAVIVKTVDAQTRAKTGINELLQGMRERAAARPPQTGRVRRFVRPAFARDRLREIGFDSTEHNTKSFLASKILSLFLAELSAQITFRKSESRL